MDIGSPSGPRFAEKEQPSGLETVSWGDGGQQGYCYPGPFSFAKEGRGSFGLSGKRLWATFNPFNPISATITAQLLMHLDCNQLFLATNLPTPHLYIRLEEICFKMS